MECHVKIPSEIGNSRVQERTEVRGRKHGDGGYRMKRNRSDQTIGSPGGTDVVGRLESGFKAFFWRSDGWFISIRTSEGLRIWPSVRAAVTAENVACHLSLLSLVPLHLHIVNRFDFLRSPLSFNFSRFTGLQLQ